MYEGDGFNFTCEIIAYPPAEAGDITWSRDNKVLTMEDPQTGIVAPGAGYDPEGRVSLISTRSPHDTLSFSVLKSVDRAVYVCSVKTPVGNNSYGAFLRVKSKRKFKIKFSFWL